jgi:arylsulfatase
MSAHEDMIPTLLAAAGDTTVKEDLLKGKQYGDKSFKVHLDGYNLMPFFKGEVKRSPRREFIYWTDGGSVAALRFDDWKISFLRQNSVGIKVWESPFEELRWPMLTNLRMDPFERASDESTGHPIWASERMFALAPAGAFVGQWLQSFRDFPPRMKPGSFSLDRVMEAVTTAGKGHN